MDLIRTPVVSGVCHVQSPFPKNCRWVASPCACHQLMYGMLMCVLVWPSIIAGQTAHVCWDTYSSWRLFPRVGGQPQCLTGSHVPEGILSSIATSRSVGKWRLNDVGMPKVMIEMMTGRGKIA